MKNKIITKNLLTILLVAAIIVVALSGCSKNSNNNSQNLNSNNGPFPVTLKDSLGREVKIEKEPLRIISLSPSNTEILFALGLGDKVVGVTNYCDYPEEAKSKEKIGDFSNPNIEKIISLNPDLVLATTMHEKPVKRLEELKIPVIVLEPKNLEDMLDSLILVGKATGREKNAIELVDSLKKRIDAVKEKVSSLPEDKKPTVFYELWPSPITTVGPGTFVDDLITKAGGKNIASDSDKPYPVYGQEVIIAKNPDIIIFSHHGTNGTNEQTKEDIVKRPGWSNINAVKNDKVFYVDENIIQRPTPRLVDGLEQFAKIIHPEIFK
ncbi:ABC transporter substrate-binding protein [Thermovenabulum sp.]|uniref:ABC transporter substrate-binding protein n=1 Tax=Thermovenabulum sp. TaxID=3100335 RepID=UPI003C79B2C4